MYFSPNKKKAIKQLKRVKYAMKQKYSRATIKIGRLQQNMIKIKNKMKDISDSSLNNMLNDSNIPECQTKLIPEIFNAAKLKNPQNRIYSENWMLLCLLFQIRYLVLYFYCSYVRTIFLIHNTNYSYYIIFTIDHLVVINS